MSRRLNVPVSDQRVLEYVASQARVLGMSAGRPSYVMLRDLYFDTSDGALRDRRMTLCLRMEARGRQLLRLSIIEAVNLEGVVEEVTIEAPVVDGGMYATLAGTSEIGTRIRDVTEPAALRPIVAVDIDREVRELKRGWLGRPTHRVALDQLIGHGPGVTRGAQEITLTELSGGKISLETLAQRLRDGFGAEGDGLDTFERMRQALTGPEEDPRPDLPHDVRVVPIIIKEGRIALEDCPDGLTVTTLPGSGEEVARAFLQEALGPEHADVEADLVGFAPIPGGNSDLEVWIHQLSPTTATPRGFHWMPVGELASRVGAPRLRDPALIATLLLLTRSEVGRRLLREAASRRGPPTQVPVQARPLDVEPGDHPSDFLDLELSILEFNQRVLEMAEDAEIPLLERFRFLSIFSSNMDEFFVVRVGRLKDEAARGGGDGDSPLSAAKLLDLVAIRVRALTTRQYSCLTRDLLPALAERGVRLRRWHEIDPEARAALAENFLAEIFPLLTPLSMSASPGRSFPRLVSLGLSLAAVVRRFDDGRTEFAYVPVPDDIPRFLEVPGSADLITAEEVVIANAQHFFPSAEVQDVHAFRVSRIGDVEIDEDSSGSLLSAVADEVEERPFKPVVRIEVQASVPRDVRAHLLRELRAERGTDAAVLSRTDVYEVDGPIDLTDFADLARLDLPGGTFEPHEGVRPVPEGRSMFEVLAERDLLVHRPFHRFDNTVGRLLREAAADPDVVSIKLTLYRTGDDSPVMEALLQALEAGKDVSVFVELKARFDERSNIKWTRRLADAGASVVYGVVGYKTHAKTALIVRKEAEGIRRYVHIGTGNYNAATARFYTDLGLMSADPDLGADLHDFFNELMGSAGPPEKSFRRLLVAPSSLVQEIERMIQREIEHARAGRPARIQAKLNGLADRRLVEALYRASEAGVEIDLIVRSICTLRPGVRGLSENIHVRSILGRFLEHSRIYYFENAGQGEYYIGSADWRARNLRRRVEVVTPVDDPRARGTLREILDVQLADPKAWALRPDGVFERGSGSGPTSQERFMEGASVEGLTPER
jgi:polyphosphate kinase